MKTMAFEATISSDKVSLGTNELIIGIKPKTPCVINELVFEFDQQSGGAVIETQKIPLASDDHVSVLHTAAINSDTLCYKIENLDLHVNRNDRITWNITAVGDAQQLKVRGKGVSA